MPSTRPPGSASSSSPGAGSGRSPPVSPRPGPRTSTSRGMPAARVPPRSRRSSTSAPRGSWDSRRSTKPSCATTCATASPCGPTVASRRVATCSSPRSWGRRSSRSGPRRWSRSGATWPASATWIRARRASPPSARICGPSSPGRPRWSSGSSLPSPRTCAASWRRSGLDRSVPSSAKAGGRSDRRVPRVRSSRRWWALRPGLPMPCAGRTRRFRRGRSGMRPRPRWKPAWQPPSATRAPSPRPGCGSRPRIAPSGPG